MIDSTLHDNRFAFSSLILQAEFGYTSLCLDLGVASQGETLQQARESLVEAVTLYLETALENNLPWLRPVPPSEDPRFVDPDHVAEEFPLNITVAVHAYA